VPLYLLQDSNHRASKTIKELSAIKQVSSSFRARVSKFRQEQMQETKRERERLTTSPTTAIRVEAAMEERVEGLGLDEAEGEEPERQQRVDTCINALNIGSFFLSF
jgi:hypothetical protein